MGQARRSNKAQSDLREIWAYIAEDNSEAADELIDLILTKTSLLQDNPELGVSRPELGKRIRSFPVKSYMIYYRPEPAGGVLILRVFHNARDVRSDSVE